MSNSDLNALLDEVHFSTPDHTSIQDQDESEIENNRPSTSKMEFGLSQRVLMSDASLTKTSSVLDIFDEQKIPTVKFTSHNPDDNSVSTTGTSSFVAPVDKKRYRLIQIDEPSIFCGVIMGQGITWCMNVDCKTKHRSEDKISLFPWSIVCCQAWRKDQELGLRRTYNFVDRF